VDRAGTERGRSRKWTETGPQLDLTYQCTLEISGGQAGLWAQGDCATLGNLR
jgi:hypothetical protein